MVGEKWRKNNERKRGEVGMTAQRRWRDERKIQRERAGREKKERGGWSKGGERNRVRERERERERERH